MLGPHRTRVEELLAEAEAAHRSLISAMPPEVSAALPVDAQGITRAIDHIAAATGLSADERRQLVRPHAVNPAVLHARVYGAAPLADETVIGAFVEGARVRAAALITLASAIEDERLLAQVQTLLVENPLPTAAGHDHATEAVTALRAAYAAQEHAALLIAGRLDAPG